MMLTEINTSSSVPLLLEENFCVSIIDRNGTIIYVNQKFCDLSKYSPEELIGQSYGLLNPNYVAETSLFEIEHKLLKDKIWHRKINGFAKDGTPYWIQATIIPVFDDGGAIIQFISFDIDITKKVLTDEKYQETLLSLQNIENALDQSSVVVITNPQGIITYVNDKFCELSKYTPEELIGQTHRIVNSRFHPKSFFKEMWKTIGNGRIWKGDIKNRAKDGTEYWVNTTIVPFLNKNGKPYQYIAIRTDITAKKEAEQALKSALKNDFRQTIKNIQNMIFKYSGDGKDGLTFTLVEGQTAKKLGITEEKVILHQIQRALSKEKFSTFKHYLKRGLTGETLQFEISYSSMTFLVYLAPILENNKTIEVVGTAIDITERKNAEELVEKMAYYDYLTTLPNRRLFRIKAKDAIERAKELDDTIAIMFIDLDHFKHVNDSMGHSIGDQLLVAIGERLTNCIRKDDTVARLGGDEFVVLLTSTQASEVKAAATRIIKEISRPFDFNNHDVFVTPSIGISLFPNNGNDFDTLISNADSAMYLAKENGKNAYQFFTEEIHHGIIEKTMLENELRQALNKNQFELYYQPIIAMNTEELTGLEALIRWNHPSKGIILPADFIPIAEETELIVPIGQWVLEAACRQAQRWRENGLSIRQLHINISPRQFKQPSFVAQVKKLLADTGLHAQYLNLEITESMMTNVQLCQTILQQLREMGVNISIDDFGTGYSSLSYLGKFPITHLKIDQTFVQGLTVSNQAIVKSVIDLANNFELTVIAEGVETEEQVQYLQALHCNEAQGYFYSRPLCHKQIEQHLQKCKTPSL